MCMFSFLNSTFFRPKIATLMTNLFSSSSFREQQFYDVTLLFENSLSLADTQCCPDMTDLKQSNATLFLN